MNTDFFFGSCESSHNTNFNLFETKNAQTRTDSNVVSQMPQKSDSAIFYKRKRCTTIFNRIFSKNERFALVGPRAHPIFGKNSIKKIVVHRLRL